MTDGFDDFNRWRADARTALIANIPSERAQWAVNGARQAGLFGNLESETPAPNKTFSIPKEFLSLARTVSCHSDPDRWALLYSAVWRINHGERHLLALATDPLTRRLRLMEKAVRRDAHKAKAFVRFRLVNDEQGEHYIAWHRPDHDILPIVGPFFQRRFSVLRWTIMTPQRTAHWNGEELSFAPGLSESEAPAEDAFEEMWRTYYRATFNPARIKIDMMKREMPVRYWATMPETRIIPALLAEAPARVQAMLKYSEGMAESAADFLPDDRSIPSLRQAAMGCEGCPLYRNATCTVFGAGPEDAKLMLVGEQPGDEEDKVGKAFIGPAGQVLDDALGEAGITRDDLYITNAVKHFKFEQRGKKRMHSTPGTREIKACKPWLDAEIAAVRPKKILTLGVTAGRSLLGPGFTLKEKSGRWLEGPQGTALRASVHPAAILRATDAEQQARLYRMLVGDLREVKV